MHGSYQDFDFNSGQLPREAAEASDECEGMVLESFEFSGLAFISGPLGQGLALSQSSWAACPARRCSAAFGISWTDAAWSSNVKEVDGFRGWAMDVAEWLRALNLGQYEAAFRENSVTVDLLPNLTPEDLRDLGVTPVGHRRRLLDAIAALRRDTDVDTRAASDYPQQSQQPMAERRHISVMFCDVAGFTTLSSRLDPEDLSAVIRGYQACVIKTIAGFSGFIARYVGDGVLIYFGWPEASEADAEKAVRAALAVIAEISQASIGNERLRVRIGIATGVVVVGEPIGTGEARQQTAIGETPNRAARLQGLANPDGIVIDEATHQQIGGLFDCADMGLVGLKGLPEPGRAWQVLKEADVESRFEAFHTSALTPLVGRSEELELLLRRWAQAKSGTGRVVLISGEPGIGKSRLMAELGKSPEGEHHTRLRYFCSPYYGNSPLHPIIGQLTSAAQFDRTDTESAKWTKLRALLARTDTHAQDIALLGHLVGLNPDDPSVSSLGAQAQKERTFAALIRQLQQLSSDRPVMMLIEDVHWSDPTTRELLDLIVGRLSEMRVLAVLTFRPEYQAPWTGHAGVTSMVLSRLDRAESAYLAELLTIALPPPLLDRIAVQADGIPLFVEELSRAVTEGSVDAAANLQTLTVPTTLHGSLLARLDHLPDAKQVAQIGAMLGREFSYELVNAVADLPGQVLANGLGQLVSSGLAHCRGEPPDATYRFKHALIQDVAYSTLIRTHRQTRHSRIADVLSVRQDVAPQVLAHHLTEAGRTREAVDHWFNAGQRLAGRAAEPEAVNLYQCGLSLLLTLPPSEDRDRRELEFQMALGMPLVATLGYQAEIVRSVYERVQELGRSLADTQSVLFATYGTFVHAVSRGDNRAATLISEHASREPASEGDPACRLILNRMAGFAAFQAGRFRDARRGLDAVLKLYDPTVHRPLAGRWGHDARVAALNYLTLIVWLLGYPDQACRLMGEAFEATRWISHSGSIGMYYFTGTFFADLRRDPVELQHRLDEAIAFDREHGLHRSGAAFFQGISPSNAAWRLMVSRLQHKP